MQRDVDAMVSQFVRENRQLRREVEQLRKKVAARSADGSETFMRSLRRRLEREIGRAASLGGRRSTRTASVPARRTRRPITDPEQLEKRRAALARARQVRAERRAATT